MRLLPSLCDIKFVVHVEIMFNDRTHHVIDHVYLKNTVSNTIRIFDIVPANHNKCIRKIIFMAQTKRNSQCKNITKFDIFQLTPIADNT